MTRILTWYAVWYPPYALLPVRVTRISESAALCRWTLHVFGVRLAVWTGP